MTKVICIDAGHGGSDSGAVKGTRKEKNDVLKMALKVRDLLKAQGVSVVMTRTTDKDITINERCAIANKNKADYFLSIHRNSGGGTGHEIWVYSKASTETTNKAKVILDNICKVDGKNRGVKKGAVGYTDYGINKGSNMPSALFEMGFIDNSTDNASFDKHFNSFAVAIAKGLCSAVGVTYKTNDTNSKGENNMALKNGDKGEAVFALKALLNTAKKLGIITQSVDRNDVFGTGTERALKQFQKAVGHEETGVTCGETMNAFYCKIQSVVDNMNAGEQADQKTIKNLQSKITNAQKALK